MSTHPEPVESQRCHWKANAIGVVPVQSPLDAVSVKPTVAVPATVGRLAFTGGAPADEVDTTAVGADVADLDPEVFVAVTRAR
jgi:hypothetical protein